ncbi:MAG: SGNH/GDSL hydrolase family protein, partial [Bdellovibrionales bacterium]|nr:SGNH/GDSL hydrolase family protein [Bdellovibrionales bacterium]
MSRFHSALISLAIPFVGLLGGAILVECLLRGYLALQPKPHPWSDRPNFYFAHEELPTAQDLPHLPKKPHDVFRIGVVGDSFTFAPYMQFTDAFPQKLESMLNLNSTSLQGEVINYGVPAYSLSHEVDVVKRAIAEEADLIILQITLNDPEIKPLRPTGIQTHLRDPFGTFSPEGPLKTVFKYWKTSAFIAERLHNTESHRKYKEYFLDLFENPNSWNRYYKALKKVKRLSHHSKTPIVAFIFPLFGIPLDSRYPFWSIHEKLHSTLTELDIPYEDLQSIYAGIPLSRLQVIPNGDRHPNEIAHRMAAEEMYTWLSQHHLLPQELLIKLRYKTRTGIA